MQTPTPTTAQIQQQKAKAVAAYCALFQHGIPGLLTDIPLALPDTNGPKVEIGERFSSRYVPYLQLRVVVPLYAFVTVQSGNPMVHMTFGIRENGQCATFDFAAPPSVHQHFGPPQIGEFDLYFGGGPLGGLYNAWPGFGGDSDDIIFFLGLPKDSPSLDMAEADARLITAIGAHMLRELTNPIIGNSPGNKVAAYLTLPDDSKYKFTELWLPHTDLCTSVQSGGTHCNLD